MIKVRLIIALIVGSFTSFHSIYAQEYINKFNHISTSDGFTLNSVISMGQDKYGMMWFGTRRGLIRFDGLELKFIKKSFNHKLSSKFNDINNIFIGKSGDIWLATSEGICVYRPKTDKMQNLITSYPNSTSSSEYITCVREMQNGDIWYGTNTGLNIYNPKTKKFKRIINQPNLQSLSSNRILCIYQKQDGSIWIGTSNGLNQFLNFDKGTAKFRVFENENNNTASLSNNTINALLEDKIGNLWVGTQKGLNYLDHKKSTIRRFNEIDNTLISNEIVRALTIDKKGRLWVGTYEGIVIVETFKVVNKIKHDPDIPLSLVDNKIRTLFTDKNGSVWVGSFYGGVNYWNEKQLNFQKIDEKNGKKLSFKVISSILEDNENNIYFGTEGEGISILNTKTGNYNYLNKVESGIKLGTVKTLFLTNKYNLWIGTFTKGLIKYDLRSRSSTIYKHSNLNNKSLSSNKVLSIVGDGNTNLWVGTLDSGLNLLNTKTGLVTRIKSDSNSASAINSNTIRKLIIDKKGDLYVGTLKGLCVLPKGVYKDGSSFIDIPVYKQPNIKIKIMDVFQDREGRIWVGSVNKGLLVLKNGALHSLNLDEQLSIFSILQDKEGVLWVSSTEGIMKYIPNKGLSKIYNFNDGVPHNEFLRNSKLYASNGRIYFGGASGVTSFRADELSNIDKFAPNVVITSFKLYDKFLEPGDSTGILKQSLEETKFINLGYQQNTFAINFSMPNFIKSGKNIYEYRLKGLDDKWTSTDNPTAYYTIQQGGEYLFEVKAKNADGFNTQQTTQLKIIISNPPWKTWWAYLFYSTIIIGAFILFIYFFRSKLQLQHQLEIETRELNTREELHQKKLQFFTNISHEFRTPLTLISGFVQKLLEDYKGPHHFFKQILVIKKNTDQLTKLINELLDFRKFENHQMKLYSSKGNILEFLQEIFLSFSQQAKSNNYTYKFKSDREVIDVYFDPNKLEKVFYNLIANAFKHTPPNGNIIIEVKCLVNEVEISVTDTGDGMQSDELDRIFDKFYEIQGQKSYGYFKYGSGIGLAIVKSVVDLHKGKIAVESKLGEGSTFTINLPLGKNHLSDDEVTEELNDNNVLKYQTKEKFESSIENTFIEDLELEINDDKKCLLVVEDNLEVGQLIKDVLSKNYRVVLVENGVLGFQNALVKQPDLIISDMMMPEMDGMELCTKIKSDVRTCHIPFILLSARTSLVYKFDGLESGADDYLFKPFEVKELLLKCKNIIATHDRLKEKFLNSNQFIPSELPINSLDETMIQKAYQIVKDNISNEFFGVDQFSKDLGMSRSLLFTKVKAWTNQTPNDFILSIRIKQAAIIIEQDRYNIAEVGYKVGFKDPSYFAKIFKKHLNYSPKVYAEKFKNNSLNQSI